MTHKLSILSIAFANQDLPFGTEAATSLLVELLDPAGAVLGSTATIPGDITGIAFADLAAKHTLRLSGINGVGVMGVPALQDFVPQDYLPVTAPTDPAPPVDPTPTTAAYSLPSAVTFTLAAE
jgi:hypothetical protein